MNIDDQQRSVFDMLPNRFRVKEASDFSKSVQSPKNGLENGIETNINQSFEQDQIPIQQEQIQTNLNCHAPQLNKLADQEIKSKINQNLEFISVKQVKSEEVNQFVISNQTGIISKQKPKSKSRSKKRNGSVTQAVSFSRNAKELGQIGTKVKPKRLVSATAKQGGQKLKKKKQNANNFVNQTSYQESAPKQLDLQTRDGNLLLDRYEVEAKKFERNMDLLGKRGSVINSKAVHNNRESSPSSGWGQLVDEHSGHGVLLDQNFGPVRADQWVAHTLGASFPSAEFSAAQFTELPRQGSAKAGSNFQADLVKAKRFIYDEGVVQSFYPEQPFNTKPQMEQVITQAQNLNQILNLVDSDTNISTDFKSNKLTDSVLQRDLSNLKKAENRMLPVVADLGSPLDSGTQETPIAAAAESPVKEGRVLSINPAAKQSNYFGAEKRASSKAKRSPLPANTPENDRALLPADPVIVVNSVTAVFKNIKRKSEPFLQSYHFPEGPRQPHGEYTLTLPVISALFKSLRPLSKELAIESILGVGEQDQFVPQNEKAMEHIAPKGSKQPVEPIVTLPNYTAFFKYNRRELNREFEVVVPEAQAFATSDGSQFLNQYAPVSDASKTLNFTLSKTGTDVSDSKPEEHYSTLSSQPHQFQALNKFTNQVGPIKEMKEETDSRSPSPTNRGYSEQFKVLLNQPFEKESMVSEDAPNSIIASGQRLGSSRARVESREGPNSKSSREARKNSSAQVESMNERQESSEHSSSKMEAQSEIESLNKNLSKLKELVEEPEVKLTETDSAKLDELGLREPRATKLADLNGMTNDQEIQQWVMDNLEGSSTTGFKQYQEGASEKVRGSGGPVDKDEKSSENAGSYPENAAELEESDATDRSQDQLVYRIVCLPSISAFTKEVKRGIVSGQLEVDCEKMSDKGAEATEEIQAPVLRAEGVQSSATGQATGPVHEPAFSLPSIGAARKTIALQRFHQVVRTSQELAQGGEDTEGSPTETTEEREDAQAHSQRTEVLLLPIMTLTLPLLTAQSKKLRREAYGAQIEEEIASQQDLSAVYDLASYSMSEEFHQKTLESDIQSAAPKSEDLESENMKLQGLLDSQDLASLQGQQKEVDSADDEFMALHAGALEVKLQGIQDPAEASASSRHDPIAQAAMDTPSMSEQRSQFPSSNGSQFLPMHEESEAEQQEGLDRLPRHQGIRALNLRSDVQHTSGLGGENTPASGVDLLRVQNATPGVDLMEFDGTAGLDGDAPEDVTLSSRDSLLFEMKALHKQLIEQTCSDHKVVLEMRSLSQADLDAIKIPALIHVIDCYKNGEEAGELTEEEQSLIYKNLRAVGLPAQRIEATVKGAAKGKAGASVINQDFYTRSDGQLTARSGAAPEMLATVQAKPPVAMQQRQSQAPPRNNRPGTTAPPHIQQSQVPLGPDRQPGGPQVQPMTLGPAANNGSPEGRVPPDKKEAEAAARIDRQIEAQGQRNQHEDAEVVPVKLKKLPAVAESRAMPVGPSQRGVQPGDQNVTPALGNAALPEAPSKRSKGKVQPVALPQQPEVTGKEASPLIKKGAVLPNDIGLEDPGKTKEKRADVQQPGNLEVRSSVGESADLSREDDERDAKAKELAKDAAPVKEGEKCTCQSKDPLMMPGMMGAGEKKEGEDEDDDDEEQQLSYKALIKFIEQYHPVHPLTKERFDFGQRVTVQDYAIKLWDPCFIHVLVRQCKKACAKYYKLSRGNVDDHKGARPESLKDLPDSPSDSSELEDEVGFGGLTAAGAHLGVGAILYLQTMKTFALLFLVLTIFNLPVYFIYSQTTVGNDYTALNTAFQYFTFGNFGGTNKACSSTRLTFDPDVPQEPITLRCGLAHHYMVEVQSFGLLYMWDPRWQAETDGNHMCETIAGKNMAREPVGDETAGQRRLEDQKARTLTHDRAENTEEITRGQQREMEEVRGDRRELDPEEEAGDGPHDLEIPKVERISQNVTEWNLDTLCQSNSRYLYADDEAKEAIDDYFRENCFQKEACRLDLDNIGGRRFRDLLSPFCRRRVLGDPEAETAALRDAPILDSNQLLYVVGCQGSTYQIQGYSMHKQQLACFAVVCDLVGVYFMLYVFNKLRRLNEEYIAIIDDNQITMKDFSVQCQDVLLDKYTQDIRLIKMKVWLHFTRQFAEYRLEDNAYEVVDVALSLCNKPETLQIFKMEQTQHEINVIKSKLGAGEFKDAQFFQKKEELEDLSDMYERQKERYKAIVEAENKARRSVGILPKCHRLEFIDYIFVTFKNVECVDKVVEVLEKEPTVSRVLRCIFCVQSRKQTDKEFLGAELSVEAAVEPDEILWESLQQERAAGGGRAVLLQVMAVVFLVFSGAIQVVLEGLRFMVVAEDAPLLCPEDKSEPITPEAAYADILSPKPKGVMPCYCRQQLAEKPWTAPFINFVELDPREEDDTAYCLPWFKRTLGAWAIKFVSAVSILVLNGIISKVFKRLVQFQMKHTKIETTKRSFIQIMTLEFLNTGIIMCLVSLTGMNKAFVNYEAFVIRPEKLGYAGFDTDWYFDVGRVITVTVFLSCFWANLVDCRVYFKQFMLQFKDRRRAHNLKKFPNDEDDDQPNTKLHIQEDLERLYEGENFDCEATLSRMMSIMCTLVIFSSGMPVLYALGCLFFTSTYLANKLLFFKFYKRTDSILSREIPTTSVYLMRYAVVLKMLAGLYMLNNPSILETRDEPTKDQIPWVFDVYGQLAGGGSFTGGEALNEELATDGGAEEDAEPQSGTALDYGVYLHQQINVVCVLGSFLLYILARFSVAFGRLLYKSTVGAFIALCLKIWYMLKFCAAYILALLQKFGRYLRRQYRKSKSAARKRARRASSAVLSQATGKEQTSLAEIEEEEEQQLKAALARDRKKEDEERREEDGDADGNAGNSAVDRESAGGSTLKSENSAGAANAIEEAARRMQLIAKKAYETEVKKSRAERTDYSANMFMELNMIALDQLYERAGNEYQEFKAFFNINDATENYLHYYQPKIGGNSEKKGRIRKIREDFLELCYMSNIIEEDVKEYDQLLKKRIRDIAEVIDAHFKMIQPAILAEAEEKRDRDIEKTFAKEDYRQKIDQRIIEHKFAKNPDLQFDNPNHYTDRRKLEQLKSHQDALVKADKEDINNRRNVQRVCRMQGSIAQSYFIFDNPLYKVARKIYFGLAEEEQHQREQQEIDDINETSSDGSEYDEEGEDEMEETESDQTGSQEVLLKKRSAKGEPWLAKQATKAAEKEKAADMQ